MGLRKQTNAHLVCGSFYPLFVCYIRLHSVIWFTAQWNRRLHTVHPANPQATDMKRRDELRSLATSNDRRPVQGPPSLVPGPKELDKAIYRTVDRLHPPHFAHLAITQVAVQQNQKRKKNGLQLVAVVSDCLTPYRPQIIALGRKRLTPPNFLWMPEHTIRKL